MRSFKTSPHLQYIHPSQFLCRCYVLTRISSFRLKFYFSLSVSLSFPIPPKPISLYRGKRNVQYTIHSIYWSQIARTISAACSCCLPLYIYLLKLSLSRGPLDPISSLSRFASIQFFWSAAAGLSQPDKLLSLQLSSTETIYHMLYIYTLSELNNPVDALLVNLRRELLFFCAYGLKKLQLLLHPAKQKRGSFDLVPCKYHLNSRKASLEIVHQKLMFHFNDIKLVI